jgi:hypothetical protein
LDAFVKVVRLCNWSSEVPDRSVPHATVREIAKTPASHDGEMHARSQPLPTNRSAA